MYAKIKALKGKVKIYSDEAFPMCPAIELSAKKDAKSEHHFKSFAEYSMYANSILAMVSLKTLELKMEPKVANEKDLEDAMLAEAESSGDKEKILQAKQKVAEARLEREKSVRLAAQKAEDAALAKAKEEKKKKDAAEAKAKAAEEKKSSAQKKAEAKKQAELKEKSKDQLIADLEKNEG